MSDLRIALRGLCRAPTFAATGVLTLGVGIGMAVAMLNVFDAVLLRRLPVRDQRDLVAPRAFDRRCRVERETDLTPAPCSRVGRLLRRARRASAARSSPARRRRREAVGHRCWCWAMLAVSNP